MKRENAVELEMLQAMERTLTIMGHQIEQGRGTGFFSNLWYKATGTVEPKPLPNPVKPPQ